MMMGLYLCVSMCVALLLLLPLLVLPEGLQLLGLQLVFQRDLGQMERPGVVGSFRAAGTVEM